MQALPVSQIPFSRRRLRHDGPRPQATHRTLNLQDAQHGIPFCEPAYSARSPQRQRIARTPALSTVFEERKLRCRRHVLQDPLPGSTLRYTGIYCPRSYGATVFPGMPRVWQQEHLENFRILAKWKEFYVDITHTIKKPQRDGIYGYALELFREAFARGLLR